MKLRNFVVNLAIPMGAGPVDTAAYIFNAVCGYSGGLNPDDPFFGLNRYSITVEPIELNQLTLTALQKTDAKGKLKMAIMLGPMNELEERLDKVLDEVFK